MTNKSMAITVLCLLAVGLSIFGPSILRQYSDNNLIGKVHEKEDNYYTRGFTYNLSTQEKLYVLSMALKNRYVPESDFFAAMKSAEVQLAQASSSNYSYLPVYDTENFEFGVTEENVFSVLQRELDVFSSNGVIPSLDAQRNQQLYTVELYQALDIHDADMSAVVWHIKVRQDVPVAQFNNILLEAYVDAISGKLYYFAQRPGDSVSSYNPDDLAKFWKDYLELESISKTESKKISDIGQNTGDFSANVIGSDFVDIKTGYLPGINESFVMPLQ